MKDLQLYIACGYGNLRLHEVTTLIERGADVNYQNERFGWRCLHRAARKGFIEIMELLINAGADVNARGANGVTALHLAAYYGNDSSVAFLLAKGADILAINDGDRTPLGSALHANHETCAAILREAALEANLAEEDEEEEEEEEPDDVVELENEVVLEDEDEPEDEEVEPDEEEEPDLALEEEIHLSIRDSLYLPPEKRHHVFLTHNWGINESNHHRVSMINHELKKHGVRTWFDDECIKGNIIDTISRGISSSMAVIIFITQEYITKVSGNGRRGNDDYLKLEFEYACQRVGVDNMIVVECEDTDEVWGGLLGLLLGRHLRHSFKNNDELTTCVQGLVNQIQQRIGYSHDVICNYPNLMLLTVDQIGDGPFLNLRAIQQCIHNIHINNSYNHDHSTAAQQEQLQILHQVLQHKYPDIAQQAQQAGFNLLHLLIYFPGNILHPLTMILDKCPSVTTAVDETGRTPFHHVITFTQQNMDSRSYDLLASRTPDQVVHLALRSGAPWYEMYDIVKAKVNGLGVEDEESGLMPFMMVAVEEEGRNHVLGLNAVYELLSMKPDVLNEYIDVGVGCES